MYRKLRYPIVLLCLLIILGLSVLVVKKIYFLELLSIYYEIVLSLAVLFHDFILIPASRQQ